MNTTDIVAAANDVLTQGLELLFDLDDRSYSRVAGEPFRASIGQHYRRVLDRFVSLIQGFSTGEIDYDAPIRSPRIEREVTFATIATCDILRAFKRCTGNGLQRPCEVIFSAASGDSGAASFGSNVSDEIAYCIGYAIHHYAAIRLLCAEIGLPVPETFGVAPLALKYPALVAAG